MSKERATYEMTQLQDWRRPNGWVVGILFFHPSTIVYTCSYSGVYVVDIETGKDVLVVKTFPKCDIGNLVKYGENGFVVCDYGGCVEGFRFDNRERSSVSSLFKVSVGTDAFKILDLQNGEILVVVRDSPINIIDTKRASVVRRMKVGQTNHNFFGLINSKRKGTNFFLSESSEFKVILVDSSNGTILSTFKRHNEHSCTIISYMNSKLEEILIVNCCNQRTHIYNEKCVVIGSCVTGEGRSMTMQPSSLGKRKYLLMGGFGGSLELYSLNIEDDEMKTMYSNKLGRSTIYSLCYIKEETKNGVGKIFIGSGCSTSKIKISSISSEEIKVFMKDSDLEERVQFIRSNCDLVMVDIKIRLWGGDVMVNKLVLFSGL